MARPFEWSNKRNGLWHAIRSLENRPVYVASLMSQVRKSSSAASLQLFIKQLNVVRHPTQVQQLVKLLIVHAM